MYGGFLGTESSRDPQGDNNQTILSGEIDSDESLWSLHVVSGGSLSNFTRLEEFRITGGRANLDGTDGEGGGMYLFDANLTISRCIFEDNSGDFQHGVGMSIVKSSLTVKDCIFKNHLALQFVTTILKQHFPIVYSIIMKLIEEHAYEMMKIHPLL